MPARGLPPRWKRWGDGLTCGTCAKIARRQISIVVPIASPVGERWPVLGAALRESWGETTRAANWIATELYARDVRREPADVKLRKMPRVYLYPELRVLFPALPSITLPTLCQQVERTYREQRYELLWTRVRSLATFRYPVPVPLHRTQWNLVHQEGGAIVARVKLLDRWWDLRLAGGAAFQRQRQHLLALIGGSAIGATGAIYRTVSHAGDHRGGVADGGATVRVLLKIVAWVPRVAPRADATHTLDLTTAAGSLLEGRIHGQGVTLTIHADHVRRAIAGYEVRRARLMSDLSVVRRWRASEREGMLHRSEDLAHRHRRAMKTWLQMVAAQVAQQARKQRVGIVRYDDSEDGFQRPFPWTQLRLALRHAVEGQGITWDYASGQTAASSAEPLATDERATVSA